ncbi:hypothetical protein F4823DRAFT_568960 [Ustulina deusta]|nr:hypothetical protein F4823DRAFT_568960 [Ustulina deusta]
MQEIRNLPSVSGDPELAQIVRECMNSSEKYLFVVGPPRSGKSTRIPVILSVSSGKRVISVQPDDWVARYHAQWIQHSTKAGTYDGKRPSVGFYTDVTDMPTNFVPEYEVSFVSYRWLYRMVVAINSFEVATAGLDNHYTRMRITEERRAWERAVKAKRRACGDFIGYVILDELHSQLLTQELGYAAVYAATSGLVQPPIGFFAGTKVVVTTAYPENDTFMNCFGLSNDQIEQRTIKISMGLSPTPYSSIQERYLPENETAPNEYHFRAMKRANDILKNNKEARVLLLMDTKHSARNIARHGHRLQVKTAVLDLETETGRNSMTKNTTGQVLILATPSFSSRIPIEGITDVICWRSQLLQVLNKEIHREVFASVYVDAWELSWAKSHLDPTCKNPTIHYMFPSKVCSELPMKSGSRFDGGDFIDPLLAMIRLCPEQALRGTRPLRYKVWRPTADRALYQLSVTPETIVTLTEDTLVPVPYCVLSTSDRTTTMMKLVDRCVLDRRDAFFLGHIDHAMIRGDVGATLQTFMNMVGVAMVVFGESPIIRRTTIPVPTDDLEEVFAPVKDYLHFGRRPDFTSDAWTNAVVWMDLKGRANAAGLDFVDFAQRNFRSKIMTIDKAPLLDAEYKLRLLAGVVGLDQRAQDALCNGSFLQDVQRVSGRHDSKHGNAIEMIWEAYQYAYQFNLVYVQMENNTPKITDISSGGRMDYAWKHCTIDLFEQMKFAERKDRDGFYATASILMGLRLRNITVLPVPIVSSITDDDGAWDLHSHLSLG